MESGGGTSRRDISEEGWPRFGGWDRRGIRVLEFAALEMADSNASSIGAQDGKVRQVWMGKAEVWGWWDCPWLAGRLQLCACPLHGWWLLEVLGVGRDSEAELCCRRTDLWFLSGCFPTRRWGWGTPATNAPSPSFAFCCCRDGDAISSNC